MRLYGEAKTNENENTAARLANPRRSASSLEWITILIVLVFILIVWISTIVYTGIQCGDYVETCIAQDIAFWSVPALAIGAGSVTLVTYAIERWHKAQTEQYMSALSKHYSYTRGRDYEKALIEQIALQVAKSLASADMDTYSPNISAPHKPDTDMIIKPDPDLTNGLSLTDMFQGGKDD